jgi:hypothetical protein
MRTTLEVEITAIGGTANEIPVENGDGSVWVEAEAEVEITYDGEYVRRVTDTHQMRLAAWRETNGSWTLDDQAGWCVEQTAAAIIWHWLTDSDGRIDPTDYPDCYRNRLENLMDADDAETLLTRISREIIEAVSDAYDCEHDLGDYAA